MADGSPWPRFKSELYAFFGRNPRSNRMVVDVAELLPGYAILDIGCGPGAAVRAAASRVARAVGVDRSEPMVRIAQRRSQEYDNVEFHTGGAESLPFDRDQFDRIWTIHSFHHWDDPDRGLQEALRVLRPGGRLLVVESETRGKHGLSRTSAQDLSSHLERLGFAAPAVAKHGRQFVVSGAAS